MSFENFKKKIHRLYGHTEEQADMHRRIRLSHLEWQ